MIYARISDDPTGEQAGVRRQLDDCRSLAEARDWTVVDECTDNDISALNGKTRPGYQRVLQAVRAGEVDYVIVWQTSRLVRNRRERADA
ncbi:MAG TPA: recombinase family protein, partial [Jatrophihabitans sp.]